MHLSRWRHTCVNSALHTTDIFVHRKGETSMHTQREEQTMKNPRLLAKVGVLSLLWAMVVAIALLQPPQSAADNNQQDSAGVTYIITVTDQGNFVSRGVIALHADGTMSVTDSAQG